MVGGVLSNPEDILPTSCAVSNDHHPLLGAKFLLVTDEWHRPVQFRGRDVWPRLVIVVKQL